MDKMDESMKVVLIVGLSGIGAVLLVLMGLCIRLDSAKKRFEVSATRFSFSSCPFVPVPRPSVCRLAAWPAPGGTAVPCRYAWTRSLANGEYPKCASAPCVCGLLCAG